MIKKYKKNSARPIMIQGTASHAGKSLLTAALCRILKDRGFRVAPFKAQNMALNSYVTPDGGEIGRAQSLQAEAAGVIPTVDMNPILLKPSGDSLSQVIIHGKVYGAMTASEYHRFKKEAAKFVKQSYSRLSSLYDIIVIEGAGSPAEVNLRENDLANMGIAGMAGSPVIIAGDIDRGGVFASLVGTMELLGRDERRRVKGFIINKFRGDAGLLKPGLEFLERRTGKPVLGVVPFIKDMVLPDEDSVSLEARGGRSIIPGMVNIAVVRLPRISNFTDFDPFRCDPSVNIFFTEDPAGIKGADLAVIPGTKNTIEDLIWLKDKGFEKALNRFLKDGGAVFGICGGFQILGCKVEDPHGVESNIKSVEGLSLIDAETVLMKKKDTFQVSGEVTCMGVEVSGYEIHMGRTSGNGVPFARIKERGGKKASYNDGFVSEDRKVWGTYIHGIFDNDGFRGAFIDRLGRKRGIRKNAASKSFRSEKEASIAAVSKTVEESLMMDEILRIIGVG